MVYLPTAPQGAAWFYLYPFVPNKTTCSSALFDLHWWIHWAIPSKPDLTKIFKKIVPYDQAIMQVGLQGAYHFSSCPQWFLVDCFIRLCHELDFEVKTQWHSETHLPESHHLGFPEHCILPVCNVFLILRTPPGIVIPTHKAIIVHSVFLEDPPFLAPTLLTTGLTPTCTSFTSYLLSQANVKH